MPEESLQHTSNTNDGSEQNLPQEHNSSELLELEELIDELPVEDQNTFRELIFTFEASTSWQGPLPPPEVLKRYNEAFAGGAERVFQIAERNLQIVEKQSGHTIDMGKKVIPKRERREDKGMILLVPR